MSNPSSTPESRSWLQRLEIFSCRSASRLTSEALDRRLGWRETLVLRFHQMLCPSCRLFRDQVARLEALRRELWSGEQPDQQPMPAAYRRQIEEQLPGE